MKNSILIVFLFSFSIAFAQENNTQNNTSLDTLQTQVMKLIEYYETYEGDNPEADKKAKYDAAVDEISGGTASEQDKEEAFKIIDAYIQADKAIGQDQSQQTGNSQSFEEAVESTEEAQTGLEYLDQQKSMLMQMSYPEFEAYILESNPVSTKKDVKIAFNEMHKDDGKQVAITEADEEMSEAEKLMWAFETIENPQNYEEFKKAYKILKPEATDTEIQEAWAKGNGN